MLVHVQLLDGSAITPAFDPQHLNEVREFYSREVRGGTIAGYIIIATPHTPSVAR